MKVTIHSLRFDADQKLEEFVESKVEKLNQYFENIIGIEVTLRLDKAQNAENKIAEIKLEIPGNDLFAKKQSKTFEAATDIAVEALRRQLKKHKGKMRSE
ncbi:MAG: ribosomal subunit interface protein [Bacteroidetes bacterium GWF2_38_335]|nr:MAG: ribosomal subunit interface protein [Bacteroidetes bacterium GWF2_38_335]OFY80140.1 MAG: ribosomal subunit interface protein [Bacteroidetes bacterium RIFOXYA12_FULL_38_20]HBS88533.1 ribosome-associated translation inhibitor RaiA [Bacteroidales bacterium]